MIYVILGLFVIGIFLSAFFSGSEMGFYRASRVRFVMDGLDGDRISKRMVWLFNNPTLFVATTLIGNNVANYMVSMSVVMLAQLIFPWSSISIELLASIALSPVIFIYGELLPKSLFCFSPNRMLRQASPLFLFFSVIFSPVVAILWSLARVLENTLGQSPERVHLMLAKRELQDVLEEGLEAGILHPSQRLLAQNFILFAAKSVGDVCTPLPRVPSFPTRTAVDEILRLARRRKLSEVILYEKHKNHPRGYLRTVELLLNASRPKKIPPMRELIRIQKKELFGEAVLQMQAQREPLALVMDHDKPYGILTINQLTDPLLQGTLGSLRR